MPYVERMMDANEYREAISKLGLSQVKAGVFLGANPRTSRRWARSGPPDSVGVALAAMILLKDTGVDPLTHPAIQNAKSPPGGEPEGDQKHQEAGA